MAPSALYLEESLSLSARDATNPAKPAKFVDQHASRTSTEQALKQRIDAIDDDTCEVGGDDAFFVADLAQVYRQHSRWKLHLNRVKPHYGTCHNSLSPWFWSLTPE